MNKLSTERFETKYFGKKRHPETGEMVDILTDHFQTDPYLKWLPFTQNPSTNFYDISCGLRGVTGEFCRVKSEVYISPINDKESTLCKIEEKLKSNYKMETSDISRFKDIFTDVIFEASSLKIINPSFFVFEPLKHANEANPKYIPGQKKIANYYVSLSGSSKGLNNPDSQDLFSKIVCECLEVKNEKNTSDDGQKYYILPFIKESFKRDYEWLISQSSHAIIKYLPIFLHFYACYSILQFLLFLNKKNWDKPPTKAIEIYYMLVSERANRSSDAVVKGWASSDHLPDSLLDRFTAYTQVLDILNSLFEDENLMTFHEVICKFNSMPFNEESKQTCEEVLSQYQRRKRNTLLTRKTGKTESLPDERSITTHSFREFIDKLFELGTSLVSKEYGRNSKVKPIIYELFKIKLFSKRREHKVLVLDDDVLMLLVALSTQGRRTRIDDLFNRLRLEYGVALSYETKNLIVEHLAKLNLLDRKSDSGEAQYVHVIL